MGALGFTTTVAQDDATTPKIAGAAVVPTDHLGPGRARGYLVIHPGQGAARPVVT